MAEQQCQNTVLGGAKSVKIAPLGAEKTAAIDLGFTNGGVTLTAAVEKTDVVVDQSAVPVRKIATAAQYTLSIPLAGITPENLALAFGVELDGSGIATLTKEDYYQVWIDTDGPVNNSGVKATREFYFAKVSFNGTGEIALSRTDQQTVTLEGSIVNCPTEGKNTGFMSVNDTYAGA